MAKSPKRKVEATAATVAIPPEQRRSLGKALREKVPRASHGEWKAPIDRADPVELTLAANAGRIRNLVPIRHGRMMASPFAFFRGSAGLMASDLAHTPATGLIVQACGDAHLLNFGGFATPERNIVFDINDFDETLPAPWEWDIKRLATSAIICAQHIGLTASEGNRAVRAAVRSYREHMNNYAAMRALDVWYERIDMSKVIAALEAHPKAKAHLAARIERVHRRAASDRDYDMLVDPDARVPRIKDNLPLIYHPDASVAPGVTSNFVAELAGYRKTLPDHVRVLLDRFILYDLAIKVVGVGSVGTACYVGLFMATDDDPLFLQAKEARASVLEPYAGKSAFRHHGQRVVAGQRLMQAAADMMLGWSKGASGAHVYLRQMRDLKVKPLPELWDGNLIRRYVEICGWALARAHARSGDAARIAGYMGPSETFDEAICEFANDYADQNLQDYRKFVAAVRDGKIDAIVEEV